MIRPDLRDLINRNKPKEILNNNNNTNNDNNKNDNNNNTILGIMLGMYIKCISNKHFDETSTMHAKSKQVEFFMGSDTENVINTLFDTLLQDFNVYKKHQMKEEANLFLIVSNY